MYQASYYTFWGYASLNSKLILGIYWAYYKRSHNVSVIKKYRNQMVCNGIYI